MRSILRVCLPAVWAVAVVFSTATATQAGANDDIAKLLPADTLGYMAIPNVDAAREAMKKTGLWGLYKDEAMQDFIAPAEKAIVDELKEKLETQFKQFGLEQLPEDIPWPTGKLALAFRFVDPAEGPDAVVIAEFGAKADAFGEIYADFADKWTDNGGDLRRKDVRGGRLDIFSAGSESEDSTEEPVNAIAVARVDDVLVAGNEALVTDVLALLDGADRPTMADDENHADMLKTLEGPGEFFLYVNGKAALAIAREANPQMPPEQAERMIRALGFSNLTGAGLTIQFAPKGRIDSCMRGLIAIDGEKTGIPAVITPKDMSTTPPKTVTKKAWTFTVANYELTDVYDQALQIAMMATGQPVGMLLQGAMAMTAQNDPAGRPPVDIREDVIAQIAGPIVFAAVANPPYSEQKPDQGDVSAGVRDAARLDEALGRIHSTFIAQGNPELRRELLDVTMYLLPMFAQASPAGQQAKSTALAVADNRLIVGGEDAVAQAIRNQRRTDLESIEANPTYRYAARYLPSQAGAWGFEDGAVKNEIQWNELKRLAVSQPKRNTEDNTLTVGIGASTGSGIQGPDDVALQAFRKYLDFNKLPSFEAVRQYFGPTVSYLRGTNKGIYFEAVGLKAKE